MSEPGPAALTPWDAPGADVPRRGGPIGRWLARRLLHLAGWRIRGQLPNLPRFVVIAAPHTSNWDFIVGVLAKWGVGLHICFFGKDSLFRPPLGWFMRWVGGRPVDRTNPHGVVEQTIAAIRESPRFVLALAPEGTRKRVARWRTGFYHVAHGAGIPIVLGFFDYGRREVGFGPVVWPSGDLPADLRTIGAFYRDKRGRRPELYSGPEEAGAPEDESAPPRSAAGRRSN